MSHYIRHSILSLEEGVKIISLTGEQKSSFKFKTGGLRLRTFRDKGLCCAYCGLNATHFALERCMGQTKDKKPHLNLWGYTDQGKEILFTHDHVHARSLGGADDISNSVTACEKCNSKKSKYENRILEEVKKLKIAVDFDGLVGIVKELYQDAHVRKFWFIGD